MSCGYDLKQPMGKKRIFDIMPLRNLKYYPLLPYFFIVILAGYLLLINLDNVYFWEDEAETAMLSKSILKFGCPMVFDGSNFILQSPNSYVDDYKYIYHPWLQFYIVSLSFKLFGETTWAGRIPFAFIGVLCFLFSFSLTQKVFRNLIISSLAAVILLLNVPLLDHFRQCRYYALSTFMVLLACYTYLKWETNKLMYLCFILSLIGLFHSNYATFVPTFLAFIAHYYWANRNKTNIIKNKYTLAFSLIILTSIPWIFFLKIFKKESQLSINYFFGHFVYYLFLLNIAIPLVLFLFIPLAIKKYQYIKMQDDSLVKNFILLSLLMIMLNFIFISLNRQIFYRYLIHLIPIFSILLSYLIYLGFQNQKIIGAAFLSLLLFTNVLNYIPIKIIDYTAAKIKLEKITKKLEGFSIKSLFFIYISEINQTDVMCPTKAIIFYLNNNGKKGDMVYTNYDDLPLMFYTKLRIQSRYLLNPEWTDKYPDPDWIIIRKDWEYYQRELKDIIQKHPFKEIVLETLDKKFGNNPDPLYKYFLIENNPRPIIIYNKIDEQNLRK